MSKSDGTVLPAWISAIAAVIGLVFGSGAMRYYDSNEIGKLENVVRSLEVPGKNPRVEDGFEFRLVEFSFKDREAVIAVHITSQETSKKLSISSKTRLIDNFGNVYTPVDMQLGSKSSAYTVSETLPADIGVLARFKFENISSKATGFNLFEIITRSFSVSFPNGDLIDLLLYQS